jgi:hypothetical protein
MPEILTESFCERCGTRYTFESAAPRGAKLKGVKTLSRGLKNFVMSDGTSIDEAMAAARSETDRESTIHQLDAFHKTFNFCMSCRQYTCGNCWNEADNQCLSCSPNLGHEILPAPFPGLDARAGVPIAATDGGSNGHGEVSPSGYTDLPTFDTSAWPSADLIADQAPPSAEAQVADAPPADFLIGDTAPTISPDTLIGDPPPATLPADFLIGDTPPTISPDTLIGDTPVAPDVAPPDVPTPVVPLAAATEPVSQPEPVVAEAPAEPVVAEAPASPAAPLVPPTAADQDARAAAAAAQTSALLQRFRPGQSLDEALAEYESEHQQIEPEPVAAEALIEVEVIAEEPTAIAPEPEPEPEPVAAEAPAEAPAEPEPLAADTRRDDIVEQPTWRVVAPEEPAAVAPVVVPPEPPAPVTGPPVVPPPLATPPPAPEAAAPAARVEPQWPTQPTMPQWPTQPQWPQASSDNGLSVLGRPGVPTGGLEALWAESAREVTATPAEANRAGVQPCVSCGLSLSATARFCRRCGTRQG